MKNNLVMLGVGIVGFAGMFAVTKVWNAPRNQQGLVDSAIRPPTGEPTVATVPGMVWIAGGEFTMGTDAELGWTDEKPAHRVRVDGFLIARNQGRLANSPASHVQDPEASVLVETGEPSFRAGRHEINFARRKVRDIRFAAAAQAMTLLRLLPRSD